MGVLRHNRWRAARGACLTGGSSGPQPFRWREMRPMCIREGGSGFAARITMALSTRLHHDVEVAQRATLALLADLVLAAFVAIAVGVTVFDVGKWLAIW